MSDEGLRDTKYATLLGQVSIELSTPGSEARLERLYVKNFGGVAIRLSWWKDGNIAMRPLDLSERDFWRLVAKAIQEGLLCDEK
jgi:hypothetical protein